MREAGEIITELRADNGAYIDEITRLKAELAEARGECETLRAWLQEAHEVDVDNKEELAEAKETLVSHAQIQNSLLAELAKERQRCTEYIEERNALATELAEAREDIESLEKELRMADAAIEKWQENYIDIEKRLNAKLSLAHQEIAALKGDVKPVEWEYFSDRTYFDFCAVRPVGEKTWGNCFHVATQAEGKNLSHFLTKINAPNPWNAAMKGKDE